jgi:hypothetical protein
MRSGGIPEENRGVGEYQCGASRLGAYFFYDHGSLEAANYPCQHFALAECGCGPPDMYTFGLPNPTGPCDPHIGTCCFVKTPDPSTPATCAGRFPATFSYWEGRNGFNSPLFYEGLKNAHVPARHLHKGRRHLSGRRSFKTT